MGAEAHYTPAPAGGGIIDWRLVVGPPLTMENQLPVPIELSVWERTRVRTRSQFWHMALRGNL